MLSPSERARVLPFLLSLLNGPDGYNTVRLFLGRDHTNSQPPLEFYHADKIPYDARPEVYGLLVIQYCEEKTGTYLPPLLVRLLRPGRERSEIALVLERLEQGPSSSGSAAGGAPAGGDGDPFACLQDCELRNCVFADRTILRYYLEELARGHQRLLVINGPRRSGKSYSRELIFHLLDRTPVGRIVWIDIDDEISSLYTPDRLARNVASQLWSDIPELPEQDDKPSHWVIDLRDWLLATIQEHGQTCWVVLDGFNDPDLPEETIQLVQHLALRVQRTAPLLRLVLISYAPESLPADATRGALMETVDSLDERDIHEFFECGARSRGLDLDPDALDDAVVRVMEAADAGPADTRMQRINDALRRFLNAICGDST